MRVTRRFVFTLVWSGVLLLSFTQQGSAQCAMCSLNAENATQGENTQGRGLNDGILFLLAMPFLIGGAVGVLWYKRYRTKEIKSSFFPGQ